MPHIVPLIWQAVQDDVDKGIPIDLEAYVCRFSVMRTDLNVRTIREIVVEAISALGGCTLCEETNAKEPNCLGGPSTASHE